MGNMLPFQETPEAESMDPTQGKACNTPREHRLQSHLGKATYFPSTGPGGLMRQFRSVKGPQPGMLIVRGCPCTDLNPMDPQHEVVMVAR